MGTTPLIWGRLRFFISEEHVLWNSLREPTPLFQGTSPLPYHQKNHSLENPERAVSAILGTTREVSFLLAGTTRLTVGTSRAYLLKTAFLPPLRESTPLLRESTPLSRGRLGRCRGRLQTCQFFLFVPETSLRLSGDVSAFPDLFSSSQNFFNKFIKIMGTCLDIS